MFRCASLAIANACLCAAMRRSLAAQTTMRLMPLQGQFAVEPVWSASAMTFTIRDPSGSVIFSKASIDQGNFAFTTDKHGFHEFCFQDIAGALRFTGYRVPFSLGFQFLSRLLVLFFFFSGLVILSTLRVANSRPAKLPEKDRKAKLVTWTGADAKDFAAIAKKVPLQVRDRPS